MVTQSSILGWRIPCTEEPGGLQSMGSQRVGHNWSHLRALHGYLWGVWFSDRIPSQADHSAFSSQQPHYNSFLPWRLATTPLSFSAFSSSFFSFSIFPCLSFSVLHFSVGVRALWDFSDGSVVKNASAVQEKWERWVGSAGSEDPLEEGMAAHPGCLPAEPRGHRSLVGCSPWGRKESDTTEQLGTKGPVVKSTCSSRHSVIHPEHMECLSWKCQHTARCGKDEYKHTVSVLKERNLWGEGTGISCKMASIKIELKRR